MQTQMQTQQMQQMQMQQTETKAEDDPLDQNQRERLDEPIDAYKSSRGRKENTRNHRELKERGVFVKHTLASPQGDVKRTACDHKGPRGLKEDVV